MHVNLLPSSFVWRRLLRKRMRQWGCAFGVLGIAFLGVNATLFGQWFTDLREFQTMHAATSPILAMQAERAEIAMQSLAISQKLKRLKDTIATDRTQAFLGILAQGVRQSKDTVQVQDFQLSVSDKSIQSDVATRANSSKLNGSRPISSEDSKITKKQYQLTLRGIATESESISKFMESLQKSNVFSSIDLRSTQSKTVLERTIDEFHLECVGNE